MHDIFTSAGEVMFYLSVCLLAPFFSNGQHLSYDGCLERKLLELFCVVL